MRRDRASGAQQSVVRRWLAAAVVGPAMLLAVAACGSLPEGVDGDLGNDWGELDTPTSFVPQAQVCHTTPFRGVAPLAEYEPVGCDQPHLTETVYVGTFPDSEGGTDGEDTGDGEDGEDTGDGAGGAPPEPGSAAYREAYGECEEQAAEVLGAGFRHGRIWLGVAVPSQAGWDGGARWFRCELHEVESVYGDPVERQESLAGALEGGGGAADGSGLGLGCFTVAVEGDDNDDGEIDQMSPVACDEPHDSEFVGVWEAPDGSYPDFADSDSEAEVYDGCREQVAEYVDVPADGDLVFRTGTVAHWMSEQDWEAGNRKFRCYLWLPGAELTESLAGAGTEALPVRTE